MIAGNNDNDIGGDYENVTASTTFPCKDCGRPIKGEPSEYEEGATKWYMLCDECEFKSSGIRRIRE